MLFISTYGSALSVLAAPTGEEAADDEPEIDKGAEQALFHELDLVVEVLLNFAENCRNDSVVEVAKKRNQNDGNQNHFQSGLAAVSPVRRSPGLIPLRPESHRRASRGGARGVRSRGNILVSGILNAFTVSVASYVTRCGQKQTKLHLK